MNSPLAAVLVPSLYLISVVLFITGIKQLCSVRTARRGNIMAALGMLLAVMGTLIEVESVDYVPMFAALIVGGAIGAVSAVTVPMTDMPQMVALFNGFGGGASALVAVSNVWPRILGNASLLVHVGAIPATTTVVSLVIGAATFSGSLLAFLKLHEWIDSRPVLLPGRHVINALLLSGILVAGVWFGFVAETPGVQEILCVTLLAASLAVGFLMVLSIGGADMPVVISLLNAFSGIAAAATGFILDSQVLIICGGLVGASGLILTAIMCRAMNRSVLNVCFGGFGSVQEDGTAGGMDRVYKNVRSCSPEEASLVLEYAASVVVVPGYGLAVAQAQHVCRELADLLEKRGTKVRYAIHPVAGRMPGHMNVLLAEANVPYDRLVEMETVNPEFKNTDVALVVGANDVVNPAAEEAPDSPIFGMPILKVSAAKTVFVIKRTLSPGFAGIKNELFEHSNTMMLFGDAKEVLRSLVSELKAQ